MRVLVTGATGFIGCRVVAALQHEGIPVRALVRTLPGAPSRSPPGGGVASPQESPPGGHPSAEEENQEGGVEHVRGDLLDPVSLCRAVDGCEAVIHLAGPSRWQEIHHLRRDLDAIIVGGLRSLLEAAQIAGVKRFLHVSSATALGGSSTPRLLGEETVPDPRRLRGLPYAAAKARAEAVAASYAGSSMTVVSVLPGEVFGAPDPRWVTASSVRQILRQGWPLACRGGTSVVHRDDLASALLALLRLSRPSSRYLLGGDNLQISQLVSLVRRLGGRPPRSVPTIPSWVLHPCCRALHALRLPAPLGPELLPYATRFWMLDSSRARREFGYSPRNATATLAPVVDWLKNNNYV